MEGRVKEAARQMPRRRHRGLAIAEKSSQFNGIHVPTVGASRGTSPGQSDGLPLCALDVPWRCADRVGESVSGTPSGLHKTLLCYACSVAVPVSVNPSLTCHIERPAGDRMCWVDRASCACWL